MGWLWFQALMATLGGFLGWYLGGMDGVLYALIVFVIVDYVTGVMGAIQDKTLSSKIGAKGIFRKVIIFLLVGIAHMVDTQVLGHGGVLRTTVIFFYLTNEGVSILENAANLGLPVPTKLKSVLEKMQIEKEQEKELEAVDGVGVDMDGRGEESGDESQN
jgi:toxin secretion/phage lysis holin